MKPSRAGGSTSALTSVADRPHPEPTGMRVRFRASPTPTCDRGRPDGDRCRTALPRAWRSVGGPPREAREPRVYACLALREVCSRRMVSAALEYWTVTHGGEGDQDSPAADRWFGLVGASGIAGRCVADRSTACAGFSAEKDAVPGWWLTSRPGRAPAAHLHRPDGRRSRHPSNGFPRRS